jgi:hypothetical protein
MKKVYLGLLMIFTFGLKVQAQQWSADEIKERLNMGLKLGLGVGGVLGGELKNPTPLIGFNAGLFFHGKDTNARFNWQTGLEARFRGSNFNNGDSGNSAYTKLGLITADIPVLLNIRVGQPKTGNYKAIQVGVIAGYIVRSIVYIGDDKIPAQRDNYLSTWSKLPLKPFDLQAMVGYQKRGQITGYQLSIKYGLLNLNNNFVLPGLLPATGTGKRIGTWNVDFAFMF